MLTWFFKIISGESGRNWLSMRYSRYIHGVLAERNKSYEQNPPDNVVFIDVPGAGKLEFGTTPHNMCGDSIGFHIGCSWGFYGYGGGIIGRDNAKKLAELILKKISECPKSESEEREEYENRHIENLARVYKNEF